MTRFEHLNSQVIKAHKIGETSSLIDIYDLLGAEELEKRCNYIGVLFINPSLCLCSGIWR